MSAQVPCEVPETAPTWWQLKFEYNDDLENPSPMCSSPGRRALSQVSWSLAFLSLLTTIMGVVGWFFLRLAWKKHYMSASVMFKRDVARIESSGSVVPTVPMYDVVFTVPILDDRRVSYLAKFFGFSFFTPKLIATVTEKDFLRLQYAWLLLQASSLSSPPLPESWSLSLSATTASIPSVPLSASELHGTTPTGV